VLTGCAALFAPAASGAAVPEAADFAQPLGGVERSAGAGEHETYRSGVLEAPARFDLAGLEEEMREVELRGRVDDGAWTDWAETANGDPVWFGGMDELQIRTHGWRPAGRVHYVSVSEGTPRASERAGARVMPNVISRKQWGAQKKSGGCKPRRHADYGTVKAASVHHTVSAVDYSRSAAPGLVLGICRFHRNSNGWNDIGYNALVDRFGNIYEGRAGGLGRAVIGAQAQGVNAQTTGVAALGTHTSTPVSKRARKALVRWLVWKLPEHGLDGRGKARMVSAGGDTSRYPAGEKFRTLRIIGHRVTNFTACPGDALARELPALRKKVIREIGENSGGGVG
jgi:N-acetylmuramoyl-L-alanine amidase